MYTLRTIYAGYDVTTQCEAKVTEGKGGLPKAQISTVLPIDIGKAIGAGFHMVTAQATLYDDGVEVTSGSMLLASYGSIGEPLSFTLEQSWVDVRGSVGTDTVNDHHFPDLRDVSTGAVRPMIIGSGVKAPCYASQWAGGPTGHLTLIVAGHWLRTGTSVTINNETGFAYTTSNLQRLQDSDGRNYTAVQLSGAVFNPISGATEDEADGTYYATVHGQAMDNPVRSGYMTEAVDVIEWLLHEASGGKVDTATFTHLRAKAIGFELDGFIGETLDGFDLAQTLAGLIGGTLHPTPQGWSMLLERDSDPVEIELVEGFTAHRVGGVSYTGDDIVNQLSMTFKYNPQSTQFQGTSEVGRLKNTTAETTLSQSLYGVRSVALESHLVSQESTAVAMMLEAVRSQDRRTISVDVDRGALVRLGQVVSFTDPRVALDGAAFRIVGLVKGLNTLELELLEVI